MIPPVLAGSTLRTKYEVWNDAYGFLLTAEGQDGKRYIAKMVMEELPEGSYTEGSFALSVEATQAFFQELWDSGLRPKDGTGNSGHVAAISYHLEDMRKLVFKDGK